MNERILLGVLVLVLVLIAPVGSNGTSLGEKIVSTIRGIRNNNPGNIRLDGTRWEGMSAQQTDGAFVQFDSVEYGIRAMSRILDNYAKRGINTISSIISTWAPPTENDTASYIASVSEKVGLAPSQAVDSAHRAALIAAIIQHENGVMPYSMATINTGVQLA